MLSSTTGAVFRITVELESSTANAKRSHSRCLTFSSKIEVAEDRRRGNDDEVNITFVSFSRRASAWHHVHAHHVSIAVHGFGQYCDHCET